MWYNLFRHGKNYTGRAVCVEKVKYVLIEQCCISSKKSDALENVREMVRVLNVAEKNDAARSIAEIMSKGKYRRREGRSRFNKIYEFNHYLFNQNCHMVMTSVSGHLLNLEFIRIYRKWYSCNPLSLFEAPVVFDCQEEYLDIKHTLEREVNNCQHLILWTDCDREGENIGFEILEVCKKVNPNIQVHRARFSEITSQAVIRACNNLGPPDQRMNDAVNVRRELDLRIGASFTRFQTLRLKKVFPNVLSDQLISYGSCQFPTLGFVVERYKQVMNFIPEPFWKIKVTHQKDDILTEFSWKRGRLFDHTACLVLYQLCLEDPTARVVKVSSRNKSKWRPQPLDTVELEKVASRKLRISAKEAMNIAEKLYTKGFISYPRTETTIFPKELDFTSLVQIQCEDPNWGAFAGSILNQGPNPRQGNKSDNAHPPIHPIKYTSNLQGNEKKIYEYVVRHFLACLSKDAEGRETTIEIDIKGEQFAVSGLIILAKNYLEVYPYEKWNAKIIADYILDEVFQPSSVEMTESETNPPALLTEADLIALMEKHGIGTDATHAEHIETIKSRLYVGLNPDGRFVPGELGMGLVEGYDMMGFEMSKPHLRAELEADLKRISEGTKIPQVVLQEQVKKYREVFIKATQQANKIDTALSRYFGTIPDIVPEVVYDHQPMPVMKCPKCGTSDIIIKSKKDGKGFFLSCLGYPQCTAVMWLPESVEQVNVTTNICQQCQPGTVKLLKFKFKKGALAPFYGDELENCLAGCDPQFLFTLNVHPITASAQNNGGQISISPLSQNAPSTYMNKNNRLQSTQHNMIPTKQTILRPIQRTVNNPQVTNENRCQDKDVVCHCGKSAILLTVRKEGPNTGRQFYKCSQPPDVQCNFFLWADETTQEVNRVLNNRSFSDSISPSSTSSISAAVCSCAFPAKMLTVQKDGPNKGRKFYVCSKPPDQKCNFFQWATDDTAPGDFSNNFQTSAFGNSRPKKQRRVARSESDIQSRRRCGVCGQTGHNRKTCPYTQSTAQ